MYQGERQPETFAKPTTDGASASRLRSILDFRLPPIASLAAPTYPALIPQLARRNLIKRFIRNHRTCVAQIVLKMRCGAVRLVGGIVGIEFNHIRHVGVAFALDGIHRQRALFVGNGGLDIVLTHCVILRGFFRLHAEFKNVEYGRGLGGEGNGGDCADKRFFDDVH